MYYHYTTLPNHNIVPRATKNRELFALGMGGVFLAEAAVFRKGELFLHFLLIPLGVVRNPATSATLELGHIVFDHSHIRTIKIDKFKAFPLYGKRVFSSTLCNSALCGLAKPDYTGSIPPAQVSLLPFQRLL